MEKAQVVILCGGKGTRLREHTEEIPKPLVEIGGMPILWHIMKSYSHYGFKDFILCLGHKGEKIKDFFVNFEYRCKSDIVLEKGRISSPSKSPTKNDILDWKITFAETGAETNTGGRVKAIEKYIEHSPFFVTYGDGLSNINFNEQLAYHRKHGKAATITCIQPKSQFGIVKIGKQNLIEEYWEKPKMDQWVNGGFFVLGKEVFREIRDNEMLEQQPFKRLESKKEIVAYPFNGFWACMDTYKDSQVLNELWNGGKAPWKIWNE